MCIGLMAICVCKHAARLSNVTQTAEVCAFRLFPIVRIAFVIIAQQVVKQVKCRCELRIELFVMPKNHLRLRGKGVSVFDDFRARQHGNGTAVFPDDAMGWNGR